MTEWRCKSTGRYADGTFGLEDSEYMEEESEERANGCVVKIRRDEELNGEIDMTMSSPRGEQRSRQIQA